MSWKVYNNLAWTEEIIAPADSYKEEAGFYVETLLKYLNNHTPTLLHFGCGAGGHDYHFKRYFSVTGVDISNGMLEIARKRNPEVNYLNGDMRTINLDRCYDVCVIPDSIMYMNTLEDLKATIENAISHLNPGGLLLVVTHTKEDFIENNFVYTGEKDNIHITMFENNYIVSNSTYEATLVCLIRRDEEISVHYEIHTLGLFPYHQWIDIFEEHRLKVEEINLDHLYDQYLFEAGEYKLKVFIGILMI